MSGFIFIGGFMNLEEIKKHEVFGSISTTAKLYLHNGKIYKLFDDRINVNESILFDLYDSPVDNCARIYDLLYDEDLIGYSMKYYNGYKEIDKKRISLELKKLYAHKLIEVYNELKKRGYIYYDFHGRNILVKDSDLVLIDIDGCIENEGANDILGVGYLNNFILSFIHDCNLDLCKNKNEILRIIHSDLSYDYKEKGSLEELDEYILNIGSNDIKRMQRKLSKIR